MHRGDWHGAADSIEIAHFLTSWSKANRKQFAFEIRGINPRILSSARERDGRWFALVVECLRVPEGVRQDYLAHGDSVQIACLVLVCHHALDTDYAFLRDLQPLCKLDIYNTFPGLQHDFCSLWTNSFKLVRPGRTGFLILTMCYSRFAIYMFLYIQAPMLPR